MSVPSLSWQDIYDIISRYEPKRLVRFHFYDSDENAHCAVGVIARHLGMQDIPISQASVLFMADFLERMGLRREMYNAIVKRNDDSHISQRVRYSSMLKWIKENYL